MIGEDRSGRALRHTSIHYIVNKGKNSVYMSVLRHSDMYTDLLLQSSEHGPFQLFGTRPRAPSRHGRQ